MISDLLCFSWCLLVLFVRSCISTVNNYFCFVLWMLCYISSAPDRVKSSRSEKNSLVLKFCFVTLLCYSQTFSALTLTVLCPLNGLYCLLPMQTAGFYYLPTFMLTLNKVIKKHGEDCEGNWTEFPTERTLWENI